MKFGAVLPQYEIGADPVVLRDYAQAVEGMGYDYVLAYEHIVGANPDRPGGWTGPYTHETMFHEPFVLFGYLAGLTKQLEFATGILILPQRETVLVAKQAAQVDVLSGGRLRLGVGIGWNKVEYEAQGFDFHTRGKRIEEQVRLLRELWTKPLVKFKSDDHFINDAGINPLPVQQPIPIWFGGTADVVMERMARLGDGWMPNPMPMEVARQKVDLIHQSLAANGRSPADFGLDVRVNVQRQPQSEWDAFITEWQSMGATHVCMNTMGAGYTSIEQHLHTLRQFIQRKG